jgi:hypothetical protein
MAKTTLDAARAAQLVEALRRQRDQGNDYPIPLARLRETVDPTLSDEDLLRAAGHKSIAASIIRAAKKDVAGPVALAEDVASLAGSPLLLEYALGQLASADKPTHPVAKVVARVDKTLQPAFESAINDRIASGYMPPGMGKTEIKGKPLLFLDRFPPPPPPLPKRSSAELLSEKLLVELSARRQQGEAFVSLTDLSGPEIKGAALQKAIAAEPFCLQAVVVLVSKTLTLTALAPDRESLLCSDRLLIELLTARTTAKKPFIAINDLIQALAEPDRGPFGEQLTKRISEGRLPQQVLLRADGSTLCLASHVPATLALAERVLTTLRERQATGEGYPVSVQTLVPESTPELLSSLLADREFRSKVVQAIPGNPTGPLALIGDEVKLAASPALIECAVGLLSTAESPVHPVSRIAGKLDKSIRTAFETAVIERIAQGTIPPSVKAHEFKGKPHLRLTKHELPRPAEEVLSGKLVEMLRASRSSGNYPVLFTQLLEKTGHQPGEKVVKSAIALDPFTQQALLAVPGNPQSLVALADDQDRLASDPRLVESTLRAMRSEDNQAIALADLGKKLAPGLQSIFVAQLETQVKSRTLPSGVGCLVIKKKPHVFLFADIGALPERASGAVPVGERAERQPPLAGPDFTRLFDEAFHKLDQTGHNQVSLVRLRQEVPVERDVFDRELASLRRSGRYFLQGAEGRHGLTDEERSAGIEEYGKLLLFVSRRD